MFQACGGCHGRLPTMYRDTEAFQETEDCAGPARRIVLFPSDGQTNNVEVCVYESSKPVLQVRRQRGLLGRRRAGEMGLVILAQCCETPCSWRRKGSGFVVCGLEKKKVPSLSSGSAQRSAADSAVLVNPGAGQRRNKRASRYALIAKRKSI